MINERFLKGAHDLWEGDAVAVAVASSLGAGPMAGEVWGSLT